MLENNFFSKYKLYHVSITLPGGESDPMSGAVNLLSDPFLDRLDSRLSRS